MLFMNTLQMILSKYLVLSELHTKAKELLSDHVKLQNEKSVKTVALTVARLSLPDELF